MDKANCSFFFFEQRLRYTGRYRKSAFAVEQVVERKEKKRH